MSHFDPYDVSYFAKTNFRSSGLLFGIKQADRLLHFYCVGKSGAGKTTLLKTLMQEDLRARRGFAFLDVHGDASVEIISIIKTKFPTAKYIYFDVTNPHIDYGYNPLRKVSASKRSLVVSNILEIFERNWKSAWGMKMEHILRMILQILIRQPSADFEDILRFLHDADYRYRCLDYVKDNNLRLFIQKEFPKYKSNDLLPIMNKVGALLSHQIVKRILIDNKNRLSLRSIIDHGSILVINLAKGALGTDVSNILGGLLLTSLSSSAFSRIDTPRTFEDSLFPIYR